MTKIAIVVGHNAKAQGATRVTDGRTEFDWNSELASLIQEHDPMNVRVFTRKRGGGYSQEIDRVYAEVDSWGADVSIELHFNSSGFPSVHGGETLSSGTQKSLLLANTVREAAQAALGTKDRGVKVRGRHERGGRSLWQGRAPAIITEPYFGSNREDCHRADKYMDQLAEAYYRAAQCLKI